MDQDGVQGAKKSAASAAITGWMFAPLLMIERLALTVAAVLLVAPDWTATLIGLAILIPVGARQLAVARRVAAA